MKLYYIIINKQLCMVYRNNDTFIVCTKTKISSNVNFVYFCNLIIKLQWFTIWLLFKIVQRLPNHFFFVLWWNRKVDVSESIKVYHKNLKILMDFLLEIYLVLFLSNHETSTLTLLGFALLQYNYILC